MESRGGVGERHRTDGETHTDSHTLARAHTRTHTHTHTHSLSLSLSHTHAFTTRVLFLFVGICSLRNVMESIMCALDDEDQDM